MIWDCFVGNFLDWICILSGWFLICLGVKDVFFGIIDFFRPKKFLGTNVYKDV